MADTQPRDEHAKALKQATSRTKQLRGWVATDPTRTEEFVDALNEVTGLRLVSRLWQDCYAEATEAVGAANRLVASRGPVGPYTPTVDAARYFTALVHVATLQVGLGLPEAAGSTVDAAEAWAHQLTSDDLAGHLADRTLVWALLARARAALAAADLGRANAHADAALVEARRVGLDDAETAVLLEALRTVADARWAVGLADESIALLDEALEIWDEWTHDDLEQLPRMAKGHLDRVVAPVFALRRDLADRLEATGQLERSLSVRDELGRMGHRTAARRGEPGRVDLALARADQAWALADAGRSADALRAAEDAVNALNALLKAERPVGQHLPTQALAVPAVAHAELAAGRTDAARRTIEGLFSRLQANPGTEVADAVRALALLVRADVAEAAGDPAAATHRSAADQLVTAARQVLPSTYGHPDALLLVRSLARGTQLASVEPTPYWQVPDARSLVASTVTPTLAADVDDDEALRRIDEQREAEARQRAADEQRLAEERQERERRQAAERAAALAEVERRRAEQEAAERAERERVAADEARRQQQEAARQSPMEDENVGVDSGTTDEARRDEQERVTAEQERHDRQERERREAEAAEQQRRDDEARREAERQEQERREQELREREAAEQAERARQEAEARAAEQARRDDPLEELRTAAHRALASGEKPRITATHEQLVEALEPRAAADPQDFGRELVEALERLSDAQGWLRGRAAGRRAKQLSREFGLH